MFLAACGDEGDREPSTSGGTAAATGTAADTGADTATRDAAPTATATETASAFPVTIEHRYGATEIARAPERVVCVGFSDHDIVLALEVTPVAVREWYGGQPYATWPWAQDELGDATPEVLPPGELDLEQVVALRPDLILAVYSGLTEDEYATLSGIAPTVAQSGEHVDYGTPWPEMTRVVGRALARAARAETLIAEVEARFAEARAAHPEFEGLNGVAACSFEPGSYGMYGLGDPRAEFLAALGFALPAEVRGLVPSGSFYAVVSAEQLALLDVDLLVWFTLTDAEQPALESLPLYRGLKAARAGRDVFLGGDSPLSGALSFSSVLSLPYALDELMPVLAAASDGDPATEPAVSLDATAHDKEGRCIHPPDDRSHP
ncbi:MAG: ABC transporter substrate-binding protein [Dehalococcoidia bacterium]|nr:ABC transporter substrate-binding protein [Dehalococcoidia bacterium]